MSAMKGGYKWHHIMTGLQKKISTPPLATLIKIPGENPALLAAALVIHLSSKANPLRPPTICPGSSEKPQSESVRLHSLQTHKPSPWWIASTRIGHSVPRDSLGTHPCGTRSTRPVYFPGFPGFWSSHNVRRDKFYLLHCVHREARKDLRQDLG
ncbi:hypothetical protein CRENBAI_004783 [Crenichthys baileyi]|uniref:Uncharacterized protein n=1 Tax=Crenichthys baileyi TaxID=28760 RepID=A0AAV9R1B7_9TELE